MNVFELFAILKLDKSMYESGLKDAEKDATSSGSKIGKALGTVGKVAAGALTAATTAVVAFGKQSVSAATSYESAFTGVRKTVDATEEEYTELSNWIMEASTKMASSQEEIAGTMEIAGQLGVSGVEGLKKFTETMIMLGDTTNLNAEEAASALARFGNIAGLGAEDMDRIGSVIVDLGNNFATTEADIVTMSTRLASAGTVAGLSATDILALSTAMSSVGILAEAGGTAMSQTLAKMTKAVAEGDKNLADFAAVSGMSAEQFANTWNNKPIEAVTAFIGGLKNIKESDESMVLTLEELGLTGIRQTNMLQSLALASDMLGSSINMANDAFVENAALQNEANLRYGTTASQMQQTANAFKNLRISVGRELQPLYGQFMSFSSGVIAAMQEGFNNGGINGLAESLGQGISDGLNLVFEHLPSLMETGGKLLAGLWDGIMANIDTITNAAVEIIIMLAKGVVKALPKLAQAAVTIIIKLAEGIAKALPELVPAVVDAILYICDVLTNPDNLTALLHAAFEIISQLAWGLVAAIPRLIEGLGTIIANIVEFLMDPTNLAYIIECGLNLIFALISGIMNAVPTLIAELPNIVLSIATGLWDAIVNTDWLQLGIDIIMGIGQGLWKGVTSLFDTIKDIGGSIVDAFTSFFHIGSPSKLFRDDVGKNLGLGLAEGIDESTREVEKAMDNMMDAASGEIENSVGVGGKMEIDHTGTIRLEGVNDKGEFVAASEYVIEDIVVNILRKQARLA